MSEELNFNFPESEKRVEQSTSNEHEKLTNQTRGIDEPDERLDEEKIKSETRESLLDSNSDLSALMIWGYKRTIIPIVERLKDEIKDGKFDTLISDEAGARLPTLIFRDILRKKGPKDKEIKTQFIALGRKRDRDGYEANLIEYVREHKDEWGKVLFVTEFVGTGDTLYHVRSMFDKAGLVNYDVVALYSSKNYIKMPHLTDNPSEAITSRFFAGMAGPHVKDYGADMLKDLSREYSGVTKSRNSGAVFPIRNIDKQVENKPDKTETLINQQKINVARELVHKIAQEIIDKVWGK